jgi:alkanesulfonate monooxygenase SsuD/methylene tetrahydromethanopterin reductase-like flavin-dependent oxidoreductase (luciferase family)
VTLKLVAQYGDACNLGGNDLGVSQHKLDVLKGHCETVNRDYGEISRSTGLDVHPIGPQDDPVQAKAEARGDLSFDAYTKNTFVGTADQIREQAQPKLDLGFDYFLLDRLGEAGQIDSDRASRDRASVPATRGATPSARLPPIGASQAQNGT